jgi:3-deoxy-D-arabino-heptulosonate 7-phosphate (DAHP) synthase
MHYFRITSKGNPKKILIIGPCSIHNYDEAIEYAEKRKFISGLEARMLKIASGKQEVQASDFKNIFQGKLLRKYQDRLGDCGK